MKEERKLIQYSGSRNCHCAPSIPSLAPYATVLDDICSYPCPSSPSESCGGSINPKTDIVRAIALYEKRPPVLLPLSPPAGSRILPDGDGGFRQLNNITAQTYAPAAVGDSLSRSGGLVQVGAAGRVELGLVGIGLGFLAVVLAVGIS